MKTTDAYSASGLKALLEPFSLYPVFRSYFSYEFHNEAQGQPPFENPPSLIPVASIFLLSFAIISFCLNK
jgi:hypothetical protein